MKGRNTPVPPRQRWAGAQPGGQQAPFASSLLSDNRLAGEPRLALGSQSGKRMETAGGWHLYSSAKRMTTNTAGKSKTLAAVK